MRPLLGSMLVAQLVATSSAMAQTGKTHLGGAWRIGLTLGTSTFNGAAAAIDDRAGNIMFRPYRPTMAGLGVAYGRDRLRVGLTAKYGQPGLGLRGVSDNDTGGQAGLLIVLENAFHLASFTASASTRLVRLRGGPSLRSSLGLSLEHWTAPGTPNRTVVGPVGGLGLEFAVTGSLFATIDGELGFTPGSPFRVEDLPEGFRLRSTWRRTLQAGVGLRL